MAGTRDILNAIADDKALALFDAIVGSDYDSEMLITKVGLSRKEVLFKDISLGKGGTSKQTEW